MMKFESEDIHDRQPFIREPMLLKNYNKKKICSLFIIQQRVHKYTPFVRIVEFNVGDPQKYGHGKIDDTKSVIMMLCIKIYISNRLINN